MLELVRRHDPGAGNAFRVLVHVTQIRLYFLCTPSLSSLYNANPVFSVLLPGPRAVGRRLCRAHTGRGLLSGVLSDMEPEPNNVTCSVEALGSRERSQSQCACQF